MGKTANYDKARILELHDAGKKPGEIEAETGTPRLVIGQVIKRERNPSPAAKNERVVQPANEKQNVADKPAAKSPKKLTAKGAAALWKLLFGVIAMRLGGGWRLTDDEARQLGDATMECLGDLPDPVVGAIGTFAGPGVLAATLLTVVQTRLERAANLNGPVIEHDSGSQPPPPQHRNVPPPPPPRSNVIDLQRAQSVDSEGEPADVGNRGPQLTTSTVLRAPTKRNGGDTGAVFGIS